MDCTTPGFPVLHYLPEPGHSHPGSAYKLVCYFTNWSQDRQEPGKFTLESTDPFLCSHLIYSFASISNNKVIIKDKNEAKLYQTINSLKTKSVGEEWGAPRVGFGGEKIALNWA